LLTERQTDRQTDKQTDSGYYITSLAQVKIDNEADTMNTVRRVGKSLYREGRILERSQITNWALPIRYRLF